MVPWVCPKCGGPRGEITTKRFCEDGDWLTCHTWLNPCGHVDSYHDVIAEANQFKWEHATSIERIADASPELVMTILEKLFHEQDDDVRGGSLNRDGMLEWARS